LDDVGLRKPNTTLGRILDTGNYEKGNAFWMTKKEHGGYYSDCVIAANAGRGTGQVWNPTKILNSLRNLVRWQSPKTLRKHRTRLFCEECQSLSPVVDYKPLADRAVLACKHERPVSSMTDAEYAELVTLAESIKIVRDPVLGGYTAVSEAV
jgi:hypothetical protein